jgi:hypothetical protein
MTTFGVGWLVVMSLGFAVCGWLCVFKTSAVVGFGRKNYEKNKFVRSYPFSNMVIKPWYPIFIRCAGVFIWFWALAIIYTVVFLHFH